MVKISLVRFKEKKESAVLYKLGRPQALDSLQQNLTNIITF